MTEKAILFDTTKCIACRACQVACKQWWELPGVATINRGTYENPPDLGAETWNRIRFREIPYNGTVRWVFTRHSCMHCTRAVCVWVCPTYARSYDALGYVTINQERCIGCGRCVAYCPFEVPRLGNHGLSPRILVQSGVPRAVAYKCAFCKDRVEDGLAPACVKTCPPGALQFGERLELVKQGRARVDDLRATYPKAYLYGENELGGLHVMYVLTDEPNIHGLPENPQMGTYPLFDENTFPDWYVRTLADGKLPVFPPEARREWYFQPRLEPVPGPPEPAWPTVPRAPGLGWGTPALWSWLGVGAIGGGAALLWTIRRRIRLEKEKQKASKGDSG